MNTNDRRVAARSRSTRRLRNLTIGTTLLGLTATAGLGWVAAETYSGAAAQTALTAVIDTTATGTTSNGTTTGTVPTVTRSTGRTHASSGGS